MLQRGRQFHRNMQASWLRHHGGVREPEIERALTAATGFVGRADVLVVVTEDDEGSGIPFRLVVELKNRNFDRFSPRTLRQLIGRDRRQLMRYVSALIDLSSPDPASPDESVVMGAMVYSRGPADPSIRAFVEAFFDEEMLAVTWLDETKKQSRARLGAQPA